MKGDSVLIKQRILVTSSILAAVVLFVASLGFMTNFHKLMFDGTSDMYAYYKSIQVLNKSMFDIAIVCLLFSVVLLLMEVHKKRIGIYGMIYLSVGSIYVVVRTMTMFKYIPYFENLYRGFDFSVVANYNPSFWIFGFMQVMFGIFDVLIIVTATYCVAQYLKKVKYKRSISRGVKYDA